jgi:hypothetical protein
MEKLENIQKKEANHQMEKEAMEKLKAQRNQQEAMGHTVKIMVMSQQIREILAVKKELRILQIRKIKAMSLLLSSRLCQNSK